MVKEPDPRRLFQALGDSTKLLLLHALIRVGAVGTSTAVGRRPDRVLYGLAAGILP